VGRRLSLAIAVAGLAAALGIFLLGRRAPPDDVLRAAAAELAAQIRETAAGVQARADTLAQLPRLAVAVATDENTMRDLTTEELAFRPHAGEHIEITQMRRGGGEPRRLLRIPSESDVTLPVLAGTHVVVLANQLHVVTVVNVEPRERADELVGILAVAKQLDTSAIEQRLAARGVNAELRTIQGSITLAGHAPDAASIEEKIPLAGPGGEGAELVAAKLGRPRWPRMASPGVLLLALLAAALVWRRGPTPAARFANLPSGLGRLSSPPAGVPSRSSAATPLVGVPGRSTAPTPVRSVPVNHDPNEVTAQSPPAAEVASPQATPAMGVPPQVTPATGVSPLTTPATGVPSDPAAPSVVVPRERTYTGRVDIPIGRSGSVSLAPRPGAAPSWPIDPNAPKAAPDPHAEEYRALFAEFVKMRRTTGESVEGLDANAFAETLRQKRAAIMKQIPVKDVRFKLAFANGKAAIRYQTVT
jgi:hypothetical protein